MVGTGVFVSIGLAAGQARLRIPSARHQVEEEGEWWEAGYSPEMRHAFHKSFQLEKGSGHQLRSRKSTPNGDELELLTLNRAGDGVWTSPHPTRRRASADQPPPGRDHSLSGTDRLRARVLSSELRGQPRLHCHPRPPRSQSGETKITLTLPC